MQPQFEEDTTSSLERARERLYRPRDVSPAREESASLDREVAHGWEDTAPLPHSVDGRRHVRLAGMFFAIASVFFLISLAVAGYFFYFGGNTVSVSKIGLDIQGPSGVAGGDTVPLTLTITNRNPVALQDVAIEMTFPEGTRSADNVLAPYPRYTETIPLIASGETVTRSIRAVVFGGAGQTLDFPVSLSYGTTGSNSSFIKKSSYALSLSSTPLSVSIETLSEVVSGKPFTTKFIVRSNATVPLENVVVATTLPFGFSFISSSLPLENNTFMLGTIKPGTSKEITLTGALSGQDKEERTLRAVIGTSRSTNDRTPSIVYMTQSATFAIAAPFLRTTLSIGGDTSTTPILLPSTTHSASLSYVNTLATSVENATIEVVLSGTGIDYNTVRTTRGFYRSVDHTIVFSSDADPALGTITPGGSGLSSFTFSTIPAGSGASPTVTFSVSISGTRVGQSNVTEEVSASLVKTAKVVTSVGIDASALRTTGPFANTGAVPPKANQVTTYTIALRAQTTGSAVADAKVKTTVPKYVEYLESTSGKGTFSYDKASRSLLWNVGDLAQGETAEGFFQVSFTPSTSQKGTAPTLTGEVTFSGHDRFANTAVSASGNPASTATPRDPGYSSASSLVQ